jgi:GNAT superfamily N-acetyltransferase
MYDPLPQDGMIRKLWVGEATLYGEHLLRLDAESRRNRFGGAVSDEYVREYVERSFPHAIIHGFFVKGALRGAAELQPLSSPHEAEAAISIEQPWQGHGIGSALLACTLLSARNRSIKHLRMACLADNRRMQDLARKFSAEISLDFGGVIGKLETPRPTPLSLARELLADGHGVASAIFDVQTRMLRPDYAASG